MKHEDRKFSYGVDAPVIPTSPVPSLRLRSVTLHPSTALRKRISAVSALPFRPDIQINTKAVTAHKGTSLLLSHYLSSLTQSTAVETSSASSVAVRVSRAHLREEKPCVFNKTPVRRFIHVTACYMHRDSSLTFLQEHCGEKALVPHVKILLPLARSTFTKLWQLVSA
jgi:hypothetical protein